MQREDAEAVYEQGRGAVVSVLLALSAQNDRLQAEVGRLSVRVARRDERACSHLPIRRRQVCWSHLQRDCAFHAEGRGADQQLGEHGLDL